MYCTVNILLEQPFVAAIGLYQFANVWYVLLLSKEMSHLQRVTKLLPRAKTMYIERLSRSRAELCIMITEAIPTFITSLAAVMSHI